MQGFLQRKVCSVDQNINDEKDDRRIDEKHDQITREQSRSPYPTLFLLKGAGHGLSRKHSLISRA